MRAITRISAASADRPVSIYGVRTGEAAAAENSALIAGTLASVAETVYWPSGDYYLDNSAPLTVTDSGVHWRFAPGARLLFTDNTKIGMRFNGGTGLRIEGMTVDYATTPPARVVGQESLYFIDLIDPLVSGVRVLNSPSAGMLFSKCLRPKVSDYWVQDVHADGLHFRNCLDPQVNGVTTIDTGDDGVSVQNMSANADNPGGLLTNLLVRRSGARGITIIGQRDVTLTNFLVDTTEAQGMGVAGEGTPYRTPSNVRIANGSIKNAGTNGFYLSGGASASLADVDILDSGVRGVEATGDGDIDLNRVRVYRAGGGGMNLLNSGAARVGTVYVERSSNAGFYARVGTLYASGIRTKNTSLGDELARAVSIEDCNQVVVDGIQNIDDQPTPTGYRVGFYNSEMVGVARNIQQWVPSGTAAVQNTSSVTIS